MMHLDWVKNNQNDGWFDLLKLNLDSTYFNGLVGIYAIWYTSPSGGKMVRISYGVVGEKLKIEKSNPEILKYSTLGPLKVTWAICNTNVALNILAFLINKYSPILGDNVAFGTNETVVNFIGQ